MRRPVKLHQIIFLTLSFLAGLYCGAQIKMFYESSTFKPYAWQVAPDILNCYGDEFSELQMKRAMEYWAIRGYKTGEYIHDPPAELCEREWITGAITLRKSKGLPASTLASTRRYSTFMLMKGSVIRYKPGSFNLDLLNEHELGHALGFTHLEIENHIMHPRYDKMGRNFWIPAG